MAVTVTGTPDVQSNTHSGSDKTLTFASITYGANEILTVDVIVNTATTTPLPITNLPSGGGLTWTQITTVTQAAAGGRTTSWWAATGAGGTYAVTQLTTRNGNAECNTRGVLTRHLGAHLTVPIGAIDTHGAATDMLTSNTNLRLVNVVTGSMIHAAAGDWSAGTTVTLSFDNSVGDTEAINALESGQMHFCAWRSTNALAGNIADLRAECDVTGATGNWNAVMYELLQAGAAGVTGTVAVTLAAFTSTASGTYTPPAVTGTVAVTLGAFTSSATGTYIPPPVSGTVAVTLAAFVPAASGTVTAPGVTGTVAVTLAPFTAAASGTYTPPAITGTVAVTLAPFVSAASGTVAGPGAITGTVAVTLSPFISSAAGTTTPPAITGTVARTLGLFVAAASGTVAGPGAITGSVAVTFGPFTSSASGTAGVPAITGTVAVTLGLFVCVAFDVPPALSVVRRSNVRAEVRVALVAAETRTTRVHGETRIPPVAAEDRVTRVRASTRVPVEAV